MQILRIILLGFACFSVGNLHAFQGGELPNPSDPSLGIVCVDASLAKEVANFAGKPAKPPKRPGAMVNFIAPKGPCDGVLREFDIIVRVGADNLKGLDDFNQRVAKSNIGDAFELSVLRLDSGWKKPETVKVVVRKSSDVYIGAMTKTVDEIDGVEKYFHPRIDSLAENRLTTYIKKKDGKYRLVLELQYKGKTFLPISTLAVKAGSGEAQTTEFEFTEQHTDIKLGSVTVWFARLANDTDLKILKAIAAADSGDVLVRLSGREGSKDRQLTELERTVIRHTIYVLRCLESLN